MQFNLCSHRIRFKIPGPIIIGYSFKATYGMRNARSGMGPSALDSFEATCVYL